MPTGTVLYCNLVWFELLFALDLVLTCRPCILTNEFPKPLVGFPPSGIPVYPWNNRLAQLVLCPIQFLLLAVTVQPHLVRSLIHLVGTKS